MIDPRLTLRLAAMEDIPFIMATERQPGFEHFVGRWTVEAHGETQANPANGYLIGMDEAGERQGFAILRDIYNAEGNVYLQRIAVAEPGRGFGSLLLDRVADWVFENTEAFRFWLHMAATNDRAAHVYAGAGFVTEGRLRLAHVIPGVGRCDALLLSMLRQEWLKRD